VDQRGGIAFKDDQNAYRLWTVTVKFSGVLSSFLQLISPALSWNCQVYESKSSTGGNAKAPTKLTEHGHRRVAKHGALMAEFTESERMTRTSCQNKGPGLCV